jgi:hypothetical protein
MRQPITASTDYLPANAEYCEFITVIAENHFQLARHQSTSPAAAARGYNYGSPFLRLSEKSAQNDG